LRGGRFARRSVPRGYTPGGVGSPSAPASHPSYREANSAGTPPVARKTTARASISAGGTAPSPASVGGRAVGLSDLVPHQARLPRGGRQPCEDRDLHGQPPDRCGGVGQGAHVDAEHPLVTESGGEPGVRPARAGRRDHEHVVVADLGEDLLGGGDVGRRAERR
jgi:hypothetical protein